MCSSLCLILDINFAGAVYLEGGLEEGKNLFGRLLFNGMVIYAMPFEHLPHLLLIA